MNTRTNAPRASFDSIVAVYGPDLTKRATSILVSYTDIEKRIQPLNMLGSGNYATVAKVSIYGIIYAMKVQPVTHNKYFFREIHAYRTILPHKNICTWYGCFRSLLYSYQMLEYLGDKTLYEEVYTSRETIDIAGTIRAIIDIFSGLAHIHKYGFAHRDIKLENLIRKDGRVKIFDLAFARTADTQHKNISGTLLYVSPEAITGERAKRESDIWAAGVCAYEMFTQNSPFGIDTATIADKIQAYAWERSPMLPAKIILLLDRIFCPLKSRISAVDACQQLGQMLDE